MTTLHLSEKALNASNYDSVFIWRYQPWVQTYSSTAELQYIWYNVFNDAMRHEIELYSTLTNSSSNFISCMLGSKGIQTPSSMMACCHDTASALTKAALKNIKDLSEINEELQKRMWFEI